MSVPKTLFDDGKIRQVMKREGSFPDGTPKLVEAPFSILRLPKDGGSNPDTVTYIHTSGIGGTGTGAEATSINDSNRTRTDFGFYDSLSPVILEEFSFGNLQAPDTWKAVQGLTHI